LTYSRASLSFTTGYYAVWQAVTLEAAERAFIRLTVEAAPSGRPVGQPG
jgi:hypothetical protein